MQVHFYSFFFPLSFLTFYFILAMQVIFNMCIYWNDSGFSIAHQCKNKCVLYSCKSVEFSLITLLSASKMEKHSRRMWCPAALSNVFQVLNLEDGVGLPDGSLIYIHPIARAIQTFVQAKKWWAVVHCWDFLLVIFKTIRWECGGAA